MVWGSVWIAFCMISSLNSQPIISGQGDFVFEYDPTTLQKSLFGLIDPSQLLNGHGLCKDQQGNLYFTFQPAVVGPTSQALVRFSPTFEASLSGHPLLSQGVPHGLRIEHDPKVKQSFLYHANNAATITKTTLDGNIIWMSNFSSWQSQYPQYWPILPTDAVVVPNTDILLVADGYGSSYIHMLDKNTGTYLGKSWGGKGNSNNPVKLYTPHGINVDSRYQSNTPIFVISDRSNHRFVWTDANGKFFDEITAASAAGMSFPCNVDIIQDKYTQEMVAVTPSLGDSNQGAFLNGSVAIYRGFGAHTEVLSRIEVEKLIGHLGHQHPHDAVLLQNGDLVVCCWSGPSDGSQFGPAKGTISYWKRIWKSNEGLVN